MAFTHRVVIDTDPGIDDVVTLALAARSPEIQILAVTTTYGNAPLALTTRNARTILRLCGRPDIPVLPGADRPRSRPLTTAPETHGVSGVGSAPVCPSRPVSVPANPAVLRDVLEHAPSPVTVITLGPLTNLAAVIEHDEALARRRIARHIGMFGNLRERGNTNRWADFNAWADPEAADLVVQSSLPTQMVGLDVTRQMTVSAGEVNDLASSPIELVRWLAMAMQFYVEFHRSQERLDGCVINDVLTVGEILVPGLLSFEPVRIRVDLDDGEHRGHTKEVGGVVGVGGEQRVPSPLQVATAVDVYEMRHLLARVFGRSWFQRFQREDSHE